MLSPPTNFYGPQLIYTLQGYRENGKLCNSIVLTVFFRYILSSNIISKYQNIHYNGLSERRYSKYGSYKVPGLVRNKLSYVLLCGGNSIHFPTLAEQKF